VFLAITLNYIVSIQDKHIEKTLHWKEHKFYTPTNVYLANIFHSTNPERHVLVPLYKLLKINNVVSIIFSNSHSNVVPNPLDRYDPSALITLERPLGSLYMIHI